MDNQIAGYDANTGERRWMVPYRAPALMLRSSPGYRDNRAYRYRRVAGWQNDFHDVE